MVLFARCARTGMPASRWPLEDTTRPLSSESSAAREPLDEKCAKRPAAATMRTAANAYRGMPDPVNITGLLGLARALCL
jgi:hypothetical protein